MTSELPDLLPCPFCGGEAFTDMLQLSLDCGVGCTECDLSGAAGYASRELAVSAWNTRANQQALEAARVEGRRAGLEEAIAAVEVLKGQCVDPHVKVWAINRAEAIRAKIDKPADPVAEAAKVLADHMKERRWQYYPIEMPLTKDGQGPATLGDDAVSVSYEVWEAGTLRAVSSHECLPDAIEAALRALAQKEGE